MGKLIYSVIESLDGYVADASGNFDWAEPGESVHSFIGDLQRSVGTELYGRRMYEVMAVWETIDALGDQPAFIEDFARLWRATDKVVYSSTLTKVTTTRTRLERAFDPAAIHRMKAEAESDISIAGPTLAAAAISAGLVDEYQLFVAPVLVGGGTPTFREGIRLELELVGQRRFDGGFVYLDYRPRTPDAPKRSGVEATDG